MSRRSAASKRYIQPDPLFKSQEVAKFINFIMEDGKKSLAESIVYDAFNLVAGKRLSVTGIEESSRSGEEGSADHSVSQKPIHSKDQNIQNDGGMRQRALETFKVALKNIIPEVEVRSRRIGGATYQVPVPIQFNRKQTLGMRWLVKFAKQRSNQTMTTNLVNEILDAVEGRGAAVKKREDVHRMAKANQAYAHYRWNN